MIDQPEKAYKPLSLSDWMVTILITFIPIANLVMLLVWAFSSETHPSKKNWAKATLIWMLIGFVLYFIFVAIFGMALLSGGALDNGY